MAAPLAAKVPMLESSKLDTAAALHAGATGGSSEVADDRLAVHTVLSMAHKSHSLVHRRAPASSAAPPASLAPLLTVYRKHVHVSLVDRCVGGSVAGTLDFEAMRASDCWVDDCDDAKSQVAPVGSLGSEGELNGSAIGKVGVVGNGSAVGKMGAVGNGSAIGKGGEEETTGHSELGDGAMTIARIGKSVRVSLDGSVSRGSAASSQYSHRMNSVVDYNGGSSQKSNSRETVEGNATLENGRTVGEKAGHSQVGNAQLPKLGDFDEKKLIQTHRLHPGKLFCTECKCLIANEIEAARHLIHTHVKKSSKEVSSPVPKRIRMPSQSISTAESASDIPQATPYASSGSLYTAINDMPTISEEELRAELERCRFMKRPYERISRIAIATLQSTSASKYVCLVCKKQFTSTFNCARHVRAGHLDLVVRCRVCSSEFTCTGSLARHWKQRHAQVGDCHKASWTRKDGKPWYTQDEYEAYLAQKKGSRDPMKHR